MQEYQVLLGHTPLSKVFAVPIKQDVSQYST